MANDRRLKALCPEGFPTDQKEGIPNDVWDRRLEDQDDFAPRIGEAFGLRTAADLRPYPGPRKALFLWWD